MALVNVNANGNAPTNTKVGDIVKTAAGNYQVLGGQNSAYATYSPEKLKSEGISYNPSSGLYSKKVTDSGINDAVNMASRGTALAGLTKSYADAISENAGNYRDAWINQQLADLSKNYSSNQNTLNKNFSNSAIGYLAQLNNLENSYKQNLQNLYDDTYINNQMALQNAANAGLTSAGQGVALGTSALMQATKKAADLQRSKDSDKNNTNLNINALLQNYGSDSANLKQGYLADILNAKGTGNMNYYNTLLQAQNADVEQYNSTLLNDIAQQYNLESLVKQTDENIRLQTALNALMPSYSGGYGGYSGGSYGSGSGNSSNSTNAQQMYFDYASAVGGDGNLLYTDDSLKLLYNYVQTHPNASSTDVKKYANSVLKLNSNGKRVKDTIKTLNGSVGDKNREKAHNEAKQSESISDMFKRIGLGMSGWYR